MDRDARPAARARGGVRFGAVLLGGAAAVLLWGGVARAEMSEMEAKRTPLTISGVSGMQLDLSGSFDRIIRIADNGTESATQNLDNSASPNYLRLRGRTKENYGNGMAWGFKAEMGVHSNPSDQADIPDETGNLLVEARSTYIWWDSGGMGKVKVGLQPGFNRHAGRVDQSGTEHAQNNDNRRWSDIELRDGTGFANVNLGELFREYDPPRGDYITYYSPTVSGFQFGASYGNDDAWQFGARYYGELEGGLKAKAAAGYNRNNESATTLGFANSEVEDSWVASGSVLLPTGLSFTGAWGLQHPAANNQFTNFAYYLKAGYWLSDDQAVSVDYGFSRGVVDPVFGDKIFGTLFGIAWEREFDAYRVYANLERIQGDRQSSAATDDVDPVNMFTVGVGINF